MGVCASVALMCALLCWALQEWVEPAWALAGTLVVGATVGIIWSNCYWGGAAAAIGGCLLLGSFTRIRRQDGDPWRMTAYAVLMGLGLAILANSRPWEGLVFSLPIGFAFLHWIVKSRAYTLRWRLLRVAAPCLLVLVLTAGAMALLLLTHYRQPDHSALRAPTEHLPGYAPDALAEGARRPQL